MADVEYTVLWSRDTDKGGHTVCISLPDLERIVVTVPPARNTHTGIADAIRMAIEHRKPVVKLP